MKRFLFLCLWLCSFCSWAAVPTFESLEPTQFATNNLRVAYKDPWTNDVGIVYGALPNSLTLITNLNSYGTFSLPSKVTLLALGTNYLDLSTNSTWLLNSPTNDATQVILSLSAGAYQGQLALITSQNGGNGFTLPDLSEQWDVPGAFVDLQGNWIGTTNRGVWLQYVAPDWVEVNRFAPGSTNGPFGGATVNSAGFVPYSDGSAFLNSPWYRVSTNQMGFYDTNVFLHIDYPANNQGMGLHTLNAGLVSGIDNTGFGSAALYTVNSGNDNSGFGFDAGASITSGDNNSAFGQGSLHDLVSGHRNTGLGSRAGYTNMVSNDNVFVGYDTSSAAATDTNTIVIGSSAVGHGPNTATIGNPSVTQLYVGNTLIGGGSSALWSSAGGVLSPSPAVDLVWIESQLADNATNVVLALDTSTDWTTGNSLNIQHHGTNVIQITPFGEIFIGPSAQQWWGGPGQFEGNGIAMVYDGAKPDDTGQHDEELSFEMDNVDDISNFTRLTIIEMRAKPAQADWLLGASYDSGAAQSYWRFVSATNGPDSHFRFHDATRDFLRFQPQVLSSGSSLVYKFGTATNMLAGDLLAAFQNNATNKFTIDYLGRLSIQGQTNLIGDSGTALTYNGTAIGGGAPVGTMVESGITTAGVVPMTTGTTGTNYVASPMQGTGTNVAFNGNITAYSATFTNMVRVPNTGSGSANVIQFGAADTGFYGYGGGIVSSLSGNNGPMLRAAALALGSASSLTWGSTTDPTTADTFLWRDAVGRIQQGTDAASPVSPQILAAADGIGTDKNGSDYEFHGGRGTGTGRGGAVIGKTSLTTTTGSTSQTESTRYYHSAKFVDLTESTATLFCNIALASSKYVGVRLNCTVSAGDGTDFQAVNSNVSFAAVSKAGTVTVGAVTQNDDATATSSGTLTVTYTAVANGAGVDIKANAVSSLTQTSLRCKWMITSLNSDDTAVVTSQ